MIKFNYPESVTVDTERAGRILDEIKHDAMGGWLELPVNYDATELAQLAQAAHQIQNESKYLLCIGIGGSYLGHRAIIEALGNVAETKVLYIGNSLDPFMLERTLNKLEGKDFSINVISKSGTTTEPAVAFRIFKQKLIERYGEEGAYRRIYATTDANQGALHDEAVAHGYQRFVVPDNIGGRYSVLTAVGLLPLLVAGIDVGALMKGAKQECMDLAQADLNENPAMRYATVRQDLYARGFNIEILSSFTPSTMYFHEWWKQLFGESEGKGKKGIFPASVVYTTDLHSLGQYMQDGRRELFETVLRFTTSRTHAPKIPSDKDNLDGLEYLAGRSLADINTQALLATENAHRAGGVPVMEVEAPELSAESLGALVYFFEYACAVSAKLMGVNPFDQPGVEEYKNEMFKLLGKPGF